MSKPPEPIAAEIPPDLAPIDEIMTRFGRWSMSRYVRRRCASAEGAYNGQRYPTSVPSREIELTNAHAMLVQRALASIDERLRTVLVILYVPRRLMNGSKQRPEVMLRLLRIPPRLSVSRHLDGLRAMQPLLADLVAYPVPMVILPPPDTESALYVRPLAGDAIHEQRAD